MNTCSSACRESYSPKYFEALSRFTDREQRSQGRKVGPGLLVLRSTARRMEKPRGRREGVCKCKHRRIGPRRL